MAGHFESIRDASDDQVSRFDGVEQIGRIVGGPIVEKAFQFAGNDDANQTGYFPRDRSNPSMFPNSQCCSSSIEREISLG